MKLYNIYTNATLESIDVNCTLFTAKMIAMNIFDKSMTTVHVISNETGEILETYKCGFLTYEAAEC